MIIKTEDLFKSTKYTSPYSYKLRKGELSIYCYGATHTNDPENKQFSELTIFIKEFLDKTKDQKRICLLESNELPNLETSDESEIVKKFGERGWLVNFCKNNKIDYVFCEKTARDEIDFLTSISDHTTAITCIFGRSLASLIGKGVTWDKAVQRSYMSLPKTNNSLIELENIIKDYNLKLKPELGKEDFVVWLMNPSNTESPLADLRRKLSDWRNENLVETIKENLNNNFNTLVVFGSAHIFQIEPELVVNLC